MLLLHCYYYSLALYVTGQIMARFWNDHTILGSVKNGNRFGMWTSHAFDAKGLKK